MLQRKYTVLEMEDLFFWYLEDTHWKTTGQLIAVFLILLIYYVLPMDFETVAWFPQEFSCGLLKIPSLTQLIVSRRRSEQELKLSLCSHHCYQILLQDGGMKANMRGLLDVTEVVVGLPLITSSRKFGLLASSYWGYRGLWDAFDAGHVARMARAGILDVKGKVVNSPQHSVCL